MKTTFYILVFSILFSCSITKDLKTENIFGKYKWYGVYGVLSTIELNEDLTFDYNWHAGLMFGTTKGTWKIEGNKIILNSERQPSVDRIYDYETIEAKRKEFDSISIKVVCPENTNLHYAVCTLKDDSLTLVEAFTDFQGETKLPNLNQADSLIIKFIGFKTIRHKMDGLVSSYMFKMKEEYDSYEYFTNECWTYKREQLFDPSIKKDKDAKMNYYEKIK
ncbi:hypothetical protein [Labilibacter marinus]|uniref:hypothetical protein n=1 Tax=Labilibacter marinus TaxID=1477105 RepID=UPI00094FF8EC|nr:hypothetical protein [Labilibacter marinus]